MKMSTKNKISALVMVLLGFISQSAFAATYFLDQSNVLADGVNYAQVGVTENGGNLDFTVTALAPLNWGFDKFYFNLGGTLGTVSLTGLPSGWGQVGSQNVSSFGIFTGGTTDPGGHLSPLTFTIDSTVSLTLANLVANSDGWLFAAHEKCGSTNCSAVNDLTSHFIAGPGGTPPVPLPAAAWLFGSALIGFASLANRRKV
jgi:hypothetical protein